MRIAITVGNIVAAIPEGNAARYGIKIVVGTITKVGRKYFYVQFRTRGETVKYDLKTLESFCDDCNSRYVLFANVDDANKELERRELEKEIRAGLWRLKELGYEETAQIYKLLFGRKDQ